MELKPGVRVFGIRPEIILALVIAEPIFVAEGVDLVVTSVIDGRHSRGSLHYAGAAVDIRTHNLSKKVVSRVHIRLREALGEDYDVVLEIDHLHLEFQPKVAY